MLPHNLGCAIELKTRGSIIGAAEGAASESLQNRIVKGLGIKVAGLLKKANLKLDLFDPSAAALLFEFRPAGASLLRALRLSIASAPPEADLRDRGT
jgi:hypothetical protein